jgi:DNA adenine methylase|tara:strand:+ start:1 stop:795 length:795 start_codon:yes stop_codon:yes gene_type:complete
MGGGSLEVRWAHEMGIQVVGYDIFWVLVNYWKHQLSNPNRLYDILKGLEPTKEQYDEIKDILLHWDKVQELFKNWKTDHYDRKSKPLDEELGAAYYWFNHNLSYGPMFLGWFSSIYLKKESLYQNSIKRVKDFSVPNLEVNCGSFDETIVAHTNDFLYCDPPYYMEKKEGDDDNKMFKAIYPNSNWPVHHQFFNHEKLRDLLHSHKGKFILSYNDCEWVRENYKDFKIKTPKWAYSYGQGETRIGKNKENNEPKESHEILIIKD